MWKPRKDAARKTGKSAYVKVIACVHFLGSARALDGMDDRSRMSKQTAGHYIRKFATDIIALYGEQYLNRFKNQDDLNTLADWYESLGFPECIEAVN